MERDTLGLADDSLIIEKIKRHCMAAIADLLILSHVFCAKKACKIDSIGYQAANLLLEQGAGAIAIAATLESLPTPFVPPQSTSIWMTSNLLCWPVFDGCWTATVLGV